MSNIVKGSLRFPDHLDDHFTTACRDDLSGGETAQFAAVNIS